MPGHVLDLSRRIEEQSGSALLPARLVPLSGAAVEDQGGRPHLRADAGGGLQASPTTPARFTIMVGDQIYADTFNRHIPIGARRHLRGVPGALPAAFGSPNMRRLLRAARPT